MSMSTQKRAAATTALLPTGVIATLAICAAKGFSGCFVAPRSGAVAPQQGSAGGLLGASAVRQPAGTSSAAQSPTLAVAAAAALAGAAVTSRRRGRTSSSALGVIEGAPLALKMKPVKEKSKYDDFPWKGYWHEGRKSEVYKLRHPHKWDSWTLGGAPSTAWIQHIHKTNIGAWYKRKEMWMKYAKNYTGQRRDCFRVAKRAVMKALRQRTGDRAKKGKQNRMVGIMRINANARLHGLNYSTLICRLKEANVNLNRVMLSNLGIYDRPILTNIIDMVEPNWREIKTAMDNKGIKKTYSVAEWDASVIPYLESRYPDMYTDTNIRFNRKLVAGGGVQYTVDMGDPKLWQEKLPKMPELANFEIPDHWLQNSTTSREEMIPDYLDIPMEDRTKSERQEDALFRQAKKVEAEKIASGKKKAPAQKAGVDRAAWFNEDQQTWFDTK